MLKTSAGGVLKYKLANDGQDTLIKGNVYDLDADYAEQLISKQRAMPVRKVAKKKNAAKNKPEIEVRDGANDTDRAND
ncbi:hypothetical protein HED60_19370 [Planctomycetales bacterium ZRK34]|nr:hypothetical protein HED60_19370 [Planctomycetales bacterium ZRK34]